MVSGYQQPEPKQETEPSAHAPLVSIGMPIYNAERWLDETLRSILGQTLTNFELVLSDNASSDGTEAICRRFATQDARVRYYRNGVNIGANRNYQAVLELAAGRYFKWASSSDLCAPTLLADSVALLESRPDAVLVSGRTILFSDAVSDGQLYADDFALLSDNPKDRYVKLFSVMKLNNPFNSVMRKDALKAVAPLDTFAAADTVLLAEMALQGKFLLIDKPLFFRRMTPETATKLKSAAEAERHLVPNAKQPLLWQSWHFQFALLRAVVRSTPIGSTWFRAVGHALRQLLWARRDLYGDIKQAIRRRQVMNE